MPQPPLSRELAQEAYDAMQAAGGNKSAAARALGIPGPTFQNRISAAVRYGLDGSSPVAVPEGFEIKSRTVSADGKESVRLGHEPGDAFSLPAGRAVGKVTTTVDGSGRIEREHIRHEPLARDPEAIAALLRDAFADAKPKARPKAPPRKVDADLLAFVPLADAHLGLLAWEGDAGHSWDTKLAVEAIGQAAQTLINSMPACGTAVVCGMGDILHASSNDNRTRSGHALDTDTRHAYTLKAACDLFVSIVDMALARHGKVVVRNLPGNHDETPSIAITYYLAAWFRNEPRVTVDTDASTFWFHRHGLVMLAAAHGHAAKPGDMVGVMAARESQMWGATEYRYAFQGHIHHKTVAVKEDGGAIVETLNSPARSDAWHHAQGYAAGRNMIGVTYSAEAGEVMRNTVALR